MYICINKMFMEIWSNIKGYEGLYQVSSFGNVKSLGNDKNRRDKLLKPGNDRGYKFVILSKDGAKRRLQVHRLVASAFLDNPDNLPVVNHKDENPSNNRVDNLEWCTYLYNNTYGTKIEKIATSHYKPIYSVNKTTNEITYYQSIKNAAELNNICKSNISRCLAGNRKTAGGYKWYYKD